MNEHPVKLETSTSSQTTDGEAPNRLQAYRIGEWIFTPDSNLLAQKDEQRRLERRCAEVLEFLCVHRGRTVTKDELLEAVWQQAAVTDHAIAVVISTLRRVLDDDSRNPRYILTVPRKGYRLVAPDDSAPANGRPGIAEAAGAGHDAVDTETGQGPSSRNRRRRKWPRTAAILGLGAVLTGAILVVGFGVEGWPSRTVETARSLRQLTFSKDFEVNPALSPDGTQVAFAWNGGDGGVRHIYVQPMGTGKALPISNPEFIGVRPAWSPDGSTVVFNRRTMPFGPDSTCQIVSVPAVGGPERVIADCGVGIGVRNAEFMPDGRHVAFAGNSKENHASQVRMLSLDTNAVWPLTAPQSDFIGDQFVSVSPNGRMLAFARAERPNEGDIYVLPLTDDYRPAGPERRLTFDSSMIAALDWHNDGKALITVSYRRGEFGLWTVPLDGGPPEAVDTGDLHPTGFDASPDGGTWVVQNLRTAVAMTVAPLSQEGLDPESAPEMKLEWADYLQASTRHDWGGRYSPDGTRIAFASDRSGQSEIWMMDAETRDIRQVTHLEGAEIDHIAWAPAGSSNEGRLAFTLRREAGIDIYILNTEDNTVEPVTAHESADQTPVWAPDGESLYFTSQRSGNWAVWKVDPKGGTAQQVTSFDAKQIGLTADGEWLYFTQGWDRRIWRWHMSGGSDPEIVTDGAEILQGQNWGVHGSNLYFAVRDGERRLFLKCFDPATGEEILVLRLPENMSLQGFDIGRGGKEILFSAFTHFEGDLFALEK